MKFRALSICLFCSSLIAANTDQDKQLEKKLCKTEEECSDLNNPCLCWCAFKPGPRAKKPEDTPHVIMEFGNKCYCADRDIVKKILNDAKKK